MRLETLLNEYTFPKIKEVTVDRTRHPGQREVWDDKLEKSVSALQKKGGAERLGRGSYAAAYSNPKRTPQDVRKVSDPQFESNIDGFYFYMQALKDHPDNTNPYFPRIREMKVYTDPEKEKLTYSVQMERLDDMRKLKHKTSFESILRRLYGDNMDNAKQFLDGMSNHPYGEPLLSIVIAAVKQEMNPLYELIVDKNFLRATKFIKQTSEKMHLGLDLHDENIMVRHSPYGPQLVFTDPLSWQQKLGMFKIGQKISGKAKSGRRV